MRHYHIDVHISEGKGIRVDPLITTDKSLASETYKNIVATMTKVHGLVPRFYGSGIARFETGEHVIFYTCEKEECQTNS